MVDGEGAGGEGDCDEVARGLVEALGSVDEHEAAEAGVVEIDGTAAVIAEGVGELVAVKADYLAADIGGSDFDGGLDVVAYGVVLAADAVGALSCAEVDDDGSRPCGDVLRIDGVCSLLRVVDVVDGDGHDDGSEDRHDGNDDKKLHQGEAALFDGRCRRAKCHVITLKVKIPSTRRR